MNMNQEIEHQTGVTGEQIVNLTGSGKHIEAKTADQLYEDLGEIMERSIFDKTLNDLVEGGFLIAAVLNDELGYHESQGLTWAKVRQFHEQNKQAILKYFIDKPDTFFLLVTTQKGKSNIVYSQIESWNNNKENRIIPIIVVDNNQQLSDQTVIGLENKLKNIKMYHLSGSAKVGSTIDNVLNAVCKYAAYGGEVPVIVGLNNNNQIDKIVKIIETIISCNKTNIEFKNIPVLYGLIFDEADKVYPQCRDRMVKYTDDNSPAKHCVGYVSATDGELIESEKYPECANASVLYGEIDSDDEKQYCALHSNEDANIKPVEGKLSDRNNVLAENTITKNLNHFKNKIKTKSGNEEYRKVIVNSNDSKKDMQAFAKFANDNECHAITVNQFGVTVHKYGDENQIHNIKARRSNLNKVLMYAYKKFKLNDSPLFVIGRRKVDRGLGFHFAPRHHHSNFNPKPEELEYIKGQPVTIDGKEGLIFTDMILGHISDKDTAVQKAGRLAGIVKQCPEFPIEGLTWWTTEETKNSILTHNKRIEHINEQAAFSFSTAIQALNRSKNAIQTIIKKDEVSEKCSNPNIIIDIPDIETINFNGVSSLNILKKHNMAAYDKYKKYKTHCWNVDTKSKYDKYCLNSILKPNSYSSVTNIRDNERSKNIIMIYLFENKLIFSPWSGEENK